MIVWLWWIFIIADRQLLCSVETIPPNFPTRETIIEACEFDPFPGVFNGSYALQKFEITRQAPPPPFCQAPTVPTGTGLLETPPSAEGLTTFDNLILLSERLAWFARPEQSAEWQNTFDQAIWNAAKAEDVPAVLLKRLIGVESQYWPLWVGSFDEVGMGQVTDAGADVVLRYDEEVFKQHCLKAIYHCESGYHILSVREQRMIRDVLRSGLRCHGCTVEQAMQHERGNMIIYAKVLRAYGCRNGWNWVEALRDYNGGTKYLIQFGLGS